MSVYKRILFSTLATLVLTQGAIASILGHSGIVLHVDKYGHLSGHSTHYDYRAYPDTSLLDALPLYDHHNILGHHDHHNIFGHNHHFSEDEFQEAFNLIEDDGEYHGSHPYYRYIKKNDRDSHSHHH